MPEPASYELITLIKRLAAVLHQNIDVWLKPYGLARTQYAVLHKLRERGSMLTGDLAISMQVEPGTLSGVVDTLEAKGLAVRVEQPQDKRRKDVRLTPAGRRLLGKIPPPGPVMQQVLLRGLNPAEVVIARNAAMRMLENLEIELQKQETA